MAGPMDSGPASSMQRWGGLVGAVLLATVLLGGWGAGAGCVETAECNEASQCSEGEICWEYECRRRCEDDDDCGTHETCRPCEDSERDENHCFGERQKACLPEADGYE